MIKHRAIFRVFSHSTNRLAGGVPFAVHNNRFERSSYLRKRVGNACDAIAPNSAPTVCFLHSHRVPIIVFSFISLQAEGQTGIRR